MRAICLKTLIHRAWADLTDLYLQLTLSTFNLEPKFRQFHQRIYNVFHGIRNGELDYEQKWFKQILLYESIKIIQPLRCDNATNMRFTNMQIWIQYDLILHMSRIRVPPSIQHCSSKHRHTAYVKPCANQNSQNFNSVLSSWSDPHRK